jgi:UDP:flavonoid glycosyltransferase YjiC (YdhE family)
VSLVVGHGGHATTMTALAHDLPLLVLPMDAKTDQPYVGKTVQRAGAGLTMSRRATPEKIRAAVEQLLVDGPQREAAARLGAIVRAVPGAATAADLIEDVVQKGVRGGASAPGPRAARR